jgi:hypothetical protein
MLFLRRTLPLVICFLTGVAMTLQYYIPHQASEDMLTWLNDWLITIGVFAFILGIYSLCHLHAVRIRRQTAGWGYSMIVFVGIAIGLGTGLASQGEVTTPEGAISPFGWMYNHMLIPLQGTMFSLLGFFVASAAFRAFRARTLEAGLLLGAALLVMFGRVPLGEYLWGLLVGVDAPVAMRDIVEWIMNTPNLAARRGVMLGVTLGAIAMSLKIIVGIERAYLGGRE